MASVERTLAWLLVLAGIFVGAFAENLEFCTGEQFQASCGHNEVLMVTSAQLGRMEVGRCIPQDEFMGCVNNVQKSLDLWCSGRRECEFDILDLDNENKHCSKALRMYLKVTFSCIRVETECSSSSSTTLTKAYGYLASATHASKSCGSARSPWILSAQPGQTINISIIDFATSDNNNFVSCKYVYGYILERALGINHTICGGKQREGGIYSSKTDKVEIIFTQKTRNTDNWGFLLHYQILGCPELERPAHAWYRREGNEAVIGCEDNDLEWQLTCTGNSWQGSMGNCTKKAAVMIAAPEQSEQVHFDTVIIMASVAGGAVVAVVVTIVIGIVYIKKYRMRQERKHIQKTYVTMEREMQAYLSPANQDASQLGHNTINPRLINTWEMMPTDTRNSLMTSLPVNCSSCTLPVRQQCQVVPSGGTAERQSIYSSVK